MKSPRHRSWADMLHATIGFAYPRVATFSSGVPDILEHFQRGEEMATVRRNVCCMPSACSWRIWTHISPTARQEMRHFWRGGDIRKRHNLWTNRLCSLRVCYLDWLIPETKSAWYTTQRAGLFTASRKQRTRFCSRRQPRVSAYFGLMIWDVCSFVFLYYRQHNSLHLSRNTLYLLRWWRHGHVRINYCCWKRCIHILWNTNLNPLSSKNFLAYFTECFPHIHVHCFCNKGICATAGTKRTDTIRKMTREAMDMNERETSTLQRYKKKMRYDNSYAIKCN